MTPEQMKVRTKRYALDVMEAVKAVPRCDVANVLSKQLVRCATSVGANYRAACRARSAVDFIAKMKIVEEEADESLYWMELLEEGRFIEPGLLRSLKAEGNEITAIAVASIKTKRAQI